jgi:hypothetical protein
MSRKSAKTRPRYAKPSGGIDVATVSLLPMEIQIGDRFRDNEFEWKVVTDPAVLHGGKSLRARIQRT